jgi:3D (Asp-Asp-Asp) domain-containing protein
MKNITKGSMFFGVIALIMTTFIFQTTAEAALVIANDSRNKQLNIQEILEESSPFIQDIYTPGIEAMSLDASINLDDDKGSDSEAASGGTSYKATAYCLRGRTASGSSVRRGIVAADPRVLPLGTKISLNAGSYSGTYTVADTGGAIKGRILDVWVPSCSEAKSFGRKRVSVRVISKKKRK